MKSIFKRLRITAIMLTGIALIGGVSLACLPKLSPAKGLLADDGASISYNDGAFYSLDGGGSDPLVLSSINFYGDITYENGSADLVFVNGNSDRVGSLRMINIEFNDKPTGDGTYYTGYISGILETTQQVVEEYFSNGARFWHEEVFDPDHEEWTWDELANLYSCDYQSSSTGAVTTYKALFLPPSGASGENQIICEYTRGSGIANVRTTIYNHNDGDPIQTGMTKNFEFLLADEPSLVGDYYEFQFGGTTGTNTFTIAAIYVSIVEEPTPGGEELTFVILNTRELELLEGAIGELSYQFSPTSYEGTFEWHSNNEDVAKVSDLGGYAEVTAVGPGTATISITSAEYPNIYDECVVTVNERSYVMYTVTYDPNGADGELATYSTDWVLEGDVFEYMLLDNMFNRPNYNFLGWSTDSSSQTPNYEEGEKVYLRSDTRYYAVWKYQEPEYYTREICFDPANGDNYITRVVEGETLPLSYEISEDLTPTYEGYTFLGWYYDGNIYQPGDVISDINESIVLVAKWGIRYTITYYPNDADGEPSPFERETSLVEGDSDTVSYEFEQQPVNYTRSGYSFVGWSIDSNAAEAEYLPNVSYSVNRDLVVFAVWVEVSQEYPFEVLFVANDDTDKTQTVNFTCPDESTVFEFPSIDEIGFERENYTFVGWSSESDGEVISGNPKIQTGLSTFYAIWEYADTPVAEEYTYEVVFNANGGSGTMEPDSFTKTTNTFEYSLPQTCGFTYDNHEFIGWSLTSDGDIISGATVISSGTTRFYAIWEYDDTPVTEEYTYEVVFNANGGSGTMEPDSFTKTTNTFEYSLPQTCGFTYPNHEFLGWSLTSDGEIISGATVISSGKTSFYAIWRSTGYSYTVTFDGNGATSGSTESVVLSGDSYSQTIVFPECGYKKEGYEFVGWGFTPDAPIKFQPDTERNDITADTTFYAIWVQTFTISFDANGGQGTMADITVQKGSNKVPACSFEREGYTFAGWAVGSPDGTVIQPDDIVNVTANYTLYAKWDLISPVDEIKITVEVPEVTLYVDDTYTVGYAVTPADASVELVWSVEDESVAKVIEDGMVVGLSVGTTSVTISDANGTASASFIVHVIEKAPAVQPENPISPETVENINNAIDTMDLSEEQTEKIQNVISENQEYISEEAGDIIYQALLGTTISSDDPEVAEAQKELVVTVVETGVAVDAGKATSISDAQEIDKALPENANFSVEGEIEEFYQRQMVELFGGQLPSKRITRASTPSYEINTDTQGKEGQEAVNYLANEQALYENMVDFVDTGVGHMGKAALKLRVCSGESVTVQVKSYVTVVKVSSFREFDQETADKEFVEAVYKAILLSMQNEVISILEKEHKPSNNAEKEAQYKQELEAVKDYETFEIMVTEVLRQKYVALTGEQIDDVEDFQPIYWEIFTAWALDKPSPYPITLEELTQTTIEQSTNRARTFTIESNLSAGEWGFIAGVGGGAILIIGAAAVVPSLLKKRKEKEGSK